MTDSLDGNRPMGGIRWKRCAGNRAFARMACAVLLLACAFFQAAGAATPYTPRPGDPIKEPWRWQTFPKLNGLGLQCLAEGKDGMMWFGVDAGVMHYDGLTWTTYTPDDGLVGAPINVLCVTRTGDVYAGSDAGISRFDGKAWHRAFPPDGDLPWSVYRMIAASDGSVWAGTAWGALNLRSDGPVLYTIPEMADVIRSQAPWLTFVMVPPDAVPVRAWRTGTGMRLIEGIVPVSAVVWAVAPGGPAAQAGIEVGDRVTAVNQYPRVTNNQTDGEAGTPVTLSVHRPARPDTFDVMLTRNKVVGTYRDFEVHSVFEDRDGALWFGMGSRLHGGELLRWQKEKGANDSAAWRLFTQADGLSLDFRPQMMQGRDGQIWTISWSGNAGVNRFDGRQWTSFFLGNLGEGQGIAPYGWSNIDTSILETQDGVVWIGGHGGRLHLLRDGQWSVYAFPDVPIPQVRLTGLVESKNGAVWVAGWGHMAARIDYATDRWTSYVGLHFQCETPDGTQWFLSEDGGVVRHKGGLWQRYGREDGIMSMPKSLFVTPDGQLWAMGGDRGSAALTQFVPADGTWRPLLTFPKFSEAFESGVEFVDRDGFLWLSAGASWESNPVQHGGVLRIDPSKVFSMRNDHAWRLDMPPDVPHYVFGGGQLADGQVLMGGSSLRSFDGDAWSTVPGPAELIRWSASLIATGYADRAKRVWFGTRNNGVYVTDGQTWTRYNVQDGLADNSVKAITQTPDGSIWVGTDRGISRFDGHTWTTHALPPELAPVAKGGLRVGRDGAIWINREGMFETVRYMPDKDPPETRIVESMDKVTQPGNVTIGWTGIDLWQRTPDAELQYAWRLDDGTWSPFASQKAKTLLALPSGRHTFEVKARDRDFNEDPTAARVSFVVVAPIWAQPWFIGVMILLVGAIGVQTRRVILRDRRLRVANVALEGQNRALTEARAAAEAASESKSAFLANMSHEIRTPLNAILGYARLLLRRGSLSEDLRQPIGTIASSGTHLLALINNILDLSRIESGRLELEQTDFDLRGLADDVQAMFAVSCQEKGIDWQVVWRDEDGRETSLPESMGVYGDAAKLRQVLINLVGNAVKFAPGGQVLLSIAPQGANTRGGTQRYRFDVCDTGRGIHPEDQRAIFEPFEQGRHSMRSGGTGLGLTIARRYIQLMGGELDLESEVGKGSRFFFSLPLLLADRIPLSQAAAPEKQVVALAEGCSVSALVVDDVLENRQVLSQMLTAIGVSVQMASNGIEAINAVAEDRPDIVFMDIWMPELDGQAATRRIKDIYGREAPVVVAVSASVLAHERKQFQEAGFDDFIAKPVHEGQIFASLARFLHVSFLYQEDVQAALDLTSVVLPEALYGRLMQAAEFGDVTQLETLVDDVRDLGAHAQPLAEHLWRLSRRLDMDAVLELLGEVAHQ